MAKFKGLGRWLKWTGHRIPKEVRAEIKDVTIEMGEKVSQEAKRIVPVRTGALRDSIHVFYECTRGKQDISVGIGTELHYAGYVEYGTRYMSARPYLVPAFLKYELEYEKRVRQILRRVGK